MFPLFATGVIDTGGKFAPGVVDTCAVDSGGKFATGINNTRETGGKICHRIIDTGGKFAAGVADTRGALDLGMSPQIFENIRNVPFGIFLGWGKTDS